MMLFLLYHMTVCLFYDSRIISYYKSDILLVYTNDKIMRLSGRDGGGGVGLTHVVKWCAKKLCMIECQEGACDFSKYTGNRVVCIPS